MRLEGWIHHWRAVVRPTVVIAGVSFYFLASCGRIGYAPLDDEPGGQGGGAAGIGRGGANLDVGVATGSSGALGSGGVATGPGGALGSGGIATGGALGSGGILAGGSAGVGGAGAGAGPGGAGGNSGSGGAGAGGASTGIDGGSGRSADAGSDRTANAVDAGVDASDASQMGRCDPLAPIRLYYRNGQAAASTTQVDYLVKVENATGNALPLSSLKVRYYLTNELAPPRTLDIFYTDTCCSNKIANFNTQILASFQTIPARANADAYLQIAFDATLGSLAPGDSVQVELALYNNGAGLSAQTNDYSFRAAAASTQAEWDLCPGPQCLAKFTTCSITVYRDNVLVWGTPP